jgi:hypothetical protein
MKMPPKIARLAGLGAFGAIAAFVALFAYIVYLCWPTPTGGIMPGLTAVSVIAGVVVVLALGAAHIAIGRQLMAVAQEGRRGV